MKNRRTLWTLLLLALVLLAAGIFVASRRSTSEYVFEGSPRALPGTKGAVKPRLAVSPNGMVSVMAVYGEEGSQVLGLTMSHDGGDTFGPMVPISGTTAKIKAHGENTPSLVQLPMASYALWQESSAGGTSIMFARAAGMAQKFDAPISILDKQTPSFSGFSNLGVAPNGDIYAVWFDGRDKAEPAGTFSVYMAKSTDKGATFSKNMKIAAGACPCCRPSIAFGQNGDVYVAWRKVYEGDVRDVVVATSHDHGTTFSEPVKVSDDHWVIHACPDSGPAMLADGKRLVVAWFTEASGKQEIRLSTSTDGARTFAKAVVASRKVLDPNHPVLSRSSDGAVLLAFQARAEGDGKNWSPAQPFVAVVDANGSVGTPKPVPSESKSSTYPDVAAASAGRAYVAWSEADGVYLSRGRIAQ